MRKSRILYSAAYHEHVETEFQTENWGCEPEKGLLPFQVANLERINGNEVWTDFTEGQSLSEIIESSEQASQTRIIRHCFYFPNTIETAVRKKRRQLKGERRVAVYRYLFLDIDCHSEADRIAAYDLIREFPIPPSMIVSSGNGFHIYWQLEPIHVVAMEKDLRRKFEIRFDRLIKSFCSYFKADQSKASSGGHSLRVPGTWNLKNPMEPLKCQTLEQNSRIYRFNEIERLAKEYEIVEKKKPGRKSRPPKQPISFIVKVISDHLRITGQSKLGKHIRRYLEFILRYKDLQYFVEGTTNRKMLGHDGLRIAEARSYFLKNGYIEKIKESDRIAKQAARYVVTSKFYDDFGFPKTKGKSRKNINEVIRRICETDVAAGERRTFQTSAYRDLRNAGMEHEAANEIIKETLSKRSCGLRHTEDEVKRDLYYLQRKFIPLGQRKSKSA